MTGRTKKNKEISIEWWPNKLRDYDQFFSQFFDCVITYIRIWNLSRMTNGYESRGESQSAWLVNTPPKVLLREVGHRRVTTWLRSLKPSTLSYLVGQTNWEIIRPNLVWHIYNEWLEESDRPKRPTECWIQSAQSWVIDRLMGIWCGVKQVQCLLYRKECIGWMPGHWEGRTLPKAKGHGEIPSVIHGSPIGKPYPSPVASPRSLDLKDLANWNI